MSGSNLSEGWGEWGGGEGRSERHSCNNSLERSEHRVWHEYCRLVVATGLVGRVLEPFFWVPCWSPTGLLGRVLVGIGLLGRALIETGIVGRVLVEIGLMGRVLFGAVPLGRMLVDPVSLNACWSDRSLGSRA